MRYLFSLFAAISMIALMGCGSSKPMQATDTGEIPDWFTNVPQDPNFIYAANTEVSQDLQLAIDKAVTGGRSEIGRQVEVRLQGLQKKFTEETGTGNDAQLLQMFTEAEKTVVSTTLSGSRVKYQKQMKDGNMWRSYVLVEYPVGAANQAFMDQIKKNDQMYTRYRASESFKELQDEVDKYDKYKQEQEQGGK